MKGSDELRCHPKNLEQETYTEKAAVHVDGFVEPGSASYDSSERRESGDHIFSDPVVAERWRDIYERAGYENRHRFDPNFSWSHEDEAKLVRKIDIRIMLWAWLMFIALDLHRKNITRAITDNMLPELGKSLWERTWVRKLVFYRGRGCWALQLCTGIAVANPKPPCFLPQSYSICDVFILWVITF